MGNKKFAFIISSLMILLMIGVSLTSAYTAYLLTNSSFSNGSYGWTSSHITFESGYAYVSSGYSSGYVEQNTMDVATSTVNVISVTWQHGVCASGNVCTSDVRIIVYYTDGTSDPFIGHHNTIDGRTTYSIYKGDLATGKTVDKVRFELDLYSTANSNTYNVNGMDYTSFTAEVGGGGGGGGGACNPCYE